MKNCIRRERVCVRGREGINRKRPRQLDEIKEKGERERKGKNEIEERQRERNKTEK